MSVARSLSQLTPSGEEKSLADAMVAEMMESRQDDELQEDSRNPKDLLKMIDRQAEQDEVSELLSCTPYSDSI